MKKDLDRLGAIRINKYGTKAQVIEYNKWNDVLVQFEQGDTTRTYWQYFDKGAVYSAYDRTVQGVGYLGEGVYKPMIPNPSRPGTYKKTKHYGVWGGILARCYSPCETGNHLQYKGCTVHPSWHNFQDFSRWYDDNYYEVDGEPVEVDKDILVTGNKVYGPATCMIVPRRINSLFARGRVDRKGLPPGVQFDRDRGKYRVICRKLAGGTVALGRFEDKYEAFKVYKRYKEQVIKEVAEQYRRHIPDKLYQALVDYEVEITD
jgi:hypothetical protein